MKKIILSVAFVMAFLGYGLYQSSTNDTAQYVATNTSAPVVVVPTVQKVVTKKKVAVATPVSTPTPVATPVPTPVPVIKPKGQYTDGTYTGSVADAYYGYVQVQATISGGKITNVAFLQYPSDRNTSRNINSRAMPLLTSEAISAQSANVNTVSGASATSGGFRTSLSDALAQAKA